MASRITDQDIARCIYNHCHGPVELRLNRGAAIPLGARHARARHRTDPPHDIDLAHSISSTLSDIEIAAGIQSYSGRAEKLRFHRWPAIPGGASLARTRDGGNNSGLIDSAHPPVVGVSDIDVARGIYGDSSWVVEVRLGRESPIAMKSLFAGTREGVNYVGRFCHGSGWQQWSAVRIERQRNELLRSPGCPDEQGYASQES